MRLLMFGDFAATGFGTVTRDLGRAFLDAGVDVRFVSWNEDGHTLEEPFASRTLIVGGRDGWLGPTPEFSRSDDEERWAKIQRDRIRSLFTLVPAIPNGMEAMQPDAVLSCADPASIIRAGIVELLPDGVAAFHYVPIEGVGIPPSWRRIWKSWQPIAMSEFGADQIEGLTGSRPAVAYHGVAASDFYQVSSTRPIIRPNTAAWLRDKADCKRHLGINPDAIVLFRADRFVPRKRFGSMFRAVAAVMDADPRIMLMLHCKSVDEGGSLYDFMSKMRPDLAARVHSTAIHDAGLTADRALLNVMYNAADIYLSTGAEGFGLTIAESLAAGTPAIGLDFSSVPEVIGDAGVTVPVGYYIENEYAFYWAGPDERKYAEALLDLVKDTAKRRLLSARGPFQVEKFSWRRAAEIMLGVFEPKTEAIAA